MCGTINVLQINNVLQIKQSVLHGSARLRIRLAQMIDSYRIRHSCTGDGIWNLMFIIFMCVHCLPQSLMPVSHPDTDFHVPWFCSSCLFVMNIFYVLTIQIPRPSLRIVYEVISIFLKHINVAFLTIFYQLLLFVLDGGGVRVWMSVHVDASGQP